MKRYLLWLFFAGPMSAISGCSQDSNAQSMIPDLPYVELARGSNVQNGIPTKKQTKIIASQADYALELANYTSAPAATINFTQGKVLLIDMGNRVSGGYSVALTRGYEDGPKVVTAIVLTVPGSGCAVTAATTNPYQFVFIPSHKEILISEHMVTTAC